MPIPGTISIQGPLPVIGRIEVQTVPQKWAYEVLTLNRPPTDNELNARGQNNWELAGAHAGHVYIFKRPA